MGCADGAAALPCIPVLSLQSLPETPFENPLGVGSGGGQLFGTTGGVMEAALRTVAELVTGQVMGKVVYNVS